MKVSVNIEGLNAAQAMRVTSLLEDLEHEQANHDTPAAPVPQPPVATAEATTPPVPQPPVATTEAVPADTPAAPVPQPPVATAEAAPVSTDDGLALEPTEGVELDKDGVPWDGRIHAKTKSKTAKGLWKKLKGVDHDLYEKLTAAYKANGTPVATAEATTPPVPQPPVATTEAAPVEGGDLTIPPFLDRRNGQGEAPVPQPPVATTEAAPAPAASPVEGLIQTAQACDCRTDISHEQMMAQVNVALADPNNPVGPVDLPKITGAFGLQTLVDCANDPATIGKIYYVLGGQ